LYDHDTDNLVVGRVDFTGNNSAGSVTVWLIPSRNAEPITANGVTRTGTTSTAAWTNLYMRGGSAWQGQLDELRIGTSFCDVVPVPEPASGLLAMLSVAGVLLGRSRRRRC
jgi:MYXO-CTERM domain-containing protein